MIKKAKILLLSIVSAFAAGGAAVASLAWFVADNELPSIDINGTSNGAYFAYGNGSSESPFGIATPRQLYNLSWLQYHGMFNEDKNNDGVIDKQFYFELADDLDMLGWEFPPIGTENYPFLGNFNGNSHIISNLTVSNKATFDKKPVSINYDVQPEIVGFFGVVGEGVGSLGYSYNSSVNALYDFTLEDLTVESKTSHTLIGLAGGYVNGSMSGVKVGESTVSVQGAEPITSITNNLSDYSLVGYTSATSTVSDFTKKVSENYNDIQSGGSIGGFGASVNFKDYNDWFWENHINKTYDTGTGSRDIGFMVNNGLSSSYSKRYNKISSSNYQLVMASPAYPANPDYEISFNIQTVSSNNYYGTNFYTASFDLNYVNESNFVGQFTETNSAKTATQTYDFTGRKINANLTYKAVHQIDFGSSRPVWAPATIYLYGTNASMVYIYTDSSHNKRLTYNNKSGVSFYYRNNAVHHLQNDNYIPLLFNDEMSQADDKNTGYIIGVNLASDSANDSAGTPRIASYASSYLNGSITNDEISTVKTYDGGQWKAINEVKEDGVVTDVTNVSFMSGKYPKARNAVASVIEGKNRIHGIHFDVSDSNTYSAGHYRGAIYQDAYIEKNMLLKSYKGTAKTTRMPKGCIDFELEDSGFITFFAGMYNSTETVTSLNFFSLFLVDRTSPTSYTLKEIKKIYKSTSWSDKNPDYVYWFDGDNEPSSHGDLVFDIETCLWPAQSKDNSLYYFEIPVNEGEYAMGAVNKSHTGGTKYQGAYMMYLDIGSNGKSAGDTVMDAQFIETTSSSDECPAGVDFNISSLVSVGGNTTCIRLTYSSSALTGSVSFVPNTSTVSVDSKITGAECCYDSGDVLDSSGSTQTIGDATGVGGGGTRIIHASIVTSSSEEWELRYQEILDGSGNITSVTYLHVTLDGDDVTSSVNASTLEVPEIFTDSIEDIKTTAIAVQLVYHGNDFTIDEIEYDETKVSLTIPPSEIGSTSLTVTYPSGNYNTLYINGNIYQS